MKTNKSVSVKCVTERLCVRFPSVTVSLGLKQWSDCFHLSCVIHSMLPGHQSESEIAGVESWRLCGCHLTLSSDRQERAPFASCFVHLMLPAHHSESETSGVVLETACTCHLTLSSNWQERAPFVYLCELTLVKGCAFLFVTWLAPSAPKSMLREVTS